MFSLFNRREIGRLAEENGRLRSEVSALHKELEQTRNQPTTAKGDLWVPPGHYYSPLVDPADAVVQRALELEEQPTTPPDAFGIRENEMLQWFEAIAGHYAAQPFPEVCTKGRRYYYGNPNFPLADALALLAFMTAWRPRRFVEIGSGFSSCAAIDINERYLDGKVEMTFVEPYPELALELIGGDAKYRDRFLTGSCRKCRRPSFKKWGAATCCSSIRRT